MEREPGPIATVKMGKRGGAQLMTINQGTPSDVVHFLSCLPPGWTVRSFARSTARITKGDDSEHFDHLMTIECSCSFGFRLLVYWDNPFHHVAVLCNPKSFKQYESATVHECNFSWLEDKRVLQIELPKYKPGGMIGGQPLVELSHKVLGIFEKMYVSDYTWGVFPDRVVREWIRTETGRAARKDLKQELEKLCRGDVKFLYRTGAQGYGLQKLKEGEHLFGLTWVFPWATGLVMQVGLNCILLDGTFRCLRPYTLVIVEAIVANESIPIAMGLSPTEDEDCYRRLYAHMAEVFGPGGVQALRSIPLVSDQGPGLKALARKLGLQWFLCHRHLINGAGASSMVGDWVRRLLKCGDHNEAKHVAKSIRFEIAALESRKKKLFRRANCRLMLETMLYAVENECDSMRFWARWLRAFCPTTSNAAEAVHGVLNRETQTARSFYSRLRIVKDVLFRRFIDRDSPDRIRERAVNRWCDGPKWDRMSEGNRRYYTSVHSFRRTGEFSELNWGFPHVWVKETLTPPEWLLTNLTPPDTWLKHGENGRIPDAELGGQKPPELAIQGTPSYIQVGRDIARTVRLISKTRKADSQAIALVVWELGAAMALQTHRVITAEEEGSWRMAVYDRCHLFAAPRAS